MRSVFINGISVDLPNNILDNKELSKASGWTATKIYRKTGIRIRHIAKEELVSEMAVAAAEKLFIEETIAKEEIDFLLLCTQSPDYFLPSTACIVQNRLGLSTSCGALDFNLGCSGYVYGLSLAKSLIMSGEANNLLLITSETYTKYIHPKDKSTRTLFGDGATATLISTSGKAKIGEFVYGTDGSGSGNLIVPAGAGVKRISADTKLERNDDNGNIRTQENLYMNGPEIFNFSLSTVPVSIDDLLAKYKLSKDNVDFFVLHQANRFMLETLRDKMDIPEEKFFIGMENYGNTVSSTIPIALKDAEDQGRITEGMKVVIVGFGVGYSWAANLLEF